MVSHRGHSFGPWVIAIVSSMFLVPFWFYHTSLAKPWAEICISAPDCSPDPRLTSPTVYLMFRRHLYLVFKTELSVAPQTSSSCSLPISVAALSLLLLGLVSWILTFSDIHSTHKSHWLTFTLCPESNPFSPLLLFLPFLSYHNNGSLSPHFHPCPCDG